MDVPLYFLASGYTCDIRQLPNQHLSRLDIWLSSRSVRLEQHQQTDERN
jgi:hypothetical protein